MSDTIFILLESAVGKDLAFRWLKAFECKITHSQATIYKFPDHDWKQKQLQTFILTRSYFFSALSQLWSQEVTDPNLIAQNGAIFFIMNELTKRFK